MNQSLIQTLKLGVLILMGLLIYVQSFAQNNARKILEKSTREQLKEYKAEAKKSIDSARRVRLLKEDSIRKKNNPDTIPFTKGYRIGLDLSKPLNRLLNSTQYEFEASLDYRYKLRYYYVGEIGYESVLFHVPGYYDYQSSGEYVKLGIDYNILKIKRRKDNNYVYTGFRLGSALVNFKADNIQIHEAYFTNIPAPTISASNKAFWLEFILGTKIEFLPHLFLGWSVRLASRLNNLTKQENYPIRIPGFGNTASGQAFNYTYSIFYSFN